jgi:hypothetical protein
VITTSNVDPRPFQLRPNEAAGPAAQTGRRGEAGPVRGLLGGGRTDRFSFHVADRRVPQRLPTEISCQSWLLPPLSPYC